MIVKPIKIKPLQKDEMRVIQIGLGAVEELFQEHLMEQKAKYFDVPNITEDFVCVIHWDRKKELLTYGVLPDHYLFGDKEIDFSYLQEKVGITTTSLYQPNRYRRIRMTRRLIK